MCPLTVFDGIRLGGGRQDNQIVFSPPPGLTASLMTTLMALIWPNSKIFVVIDAGESGPRNDTGAFLKEQNHNFAERFKDSKWVHKYLFSVDFLYVWTS